MAEEDQVPGIDPELAEAWDRGRRVRIAEEYEAPGACRSVDAGNQVVQPHAGVTCVGRDQRYGPRHEGGGARRERPVAGAGREAHTGLDLDAAAIGGDRRAVVRHTVRSAAVTSGDSSEVAQLREMWIASD